MRPSKPSPSVPSISPKPKFRKDTGKLQTFRQLPYHIALMKAAQFEAWTQDVDSFAGPTEATDSSDFD
ncbi:MAG: hypothetical protein AAF959_05330, partial [Cyanobacteria bacterium P01_D01_bin.56]